MIQSADQSSFTSFQKLQRGNTNISKKSSVRSSRNNLSKDDTSVKSFLENSSMMNTAEEEAMNSKMALKNAMNVLRRATIVPAITK